MWKQMLLLVGLAAICTGTREVVSRKQFTFIDCAVSRLEMETLWPKLKIMRVLNRSWH
jgi:hypothetical protein